MVKERRRSERLTSNLFVDLESAQTDIVRGRGVVVDVSMNGFAVQTEAPLEINETVNCYVEVPVIFKAQVVRQVSAGQMKVYGLKIRGMGLLDKFLLKKVLQGPRKTKKV